MLQAVVKIQGHQYLVSEGKRFQVSKLSKLEKDQTVELKDVFLLFDDKGITLGEPRVEKAVVKVKVMRQLRARKLIVFKYGPKDRFRKKRGFRPEYTELEITEIKA